MTRPPASLWLARLLGPAPRRDLLAGLTVGAVVIPQSLAYAELAKMPAVTGLYAAVAAMLAYAVIGSSPHSSLGPTATSAILAVAAGTTLDDQVGSGHTVATLAALAVVVGAVALAAGAARLGFLANLLSRPVLTGYIAGAALIIAAGQLGSLFGVALGKDTGPADVADVLGDLPGKIGDASLTTTAVGAASIGAMVALQRFWPRLPSALIVVAGAILASRIFDLSERGASVVGEVPRGLPDLGWPDLSPYELGALVGAGAALALVGFAETMAQGRAFASGQGQEVDANRELMALGAANLASGVCGAFPVSGSFSRNAVNVRAGGRSRRAGAVSAAAVVLSLVALTGLFEQLPRATLAAVVLVAVVPLFPMRTLRRLARLQRDDFAYAVVAAVGTVALGILPGLGIAVALSIGGLLYRVSTADTAVLGYVAEQDTWRSLERHADARTAPGVVVLRFTGPLYFANVARFHHEVAEVVAEAPSQLRRVVIDGRSISHLDVTALDTLADLHAGLERDGVELVIAGLRGTALDTLRRSDLASRVGAEHLVYPTVRQAVRS